MQKAILGVALLAILSCAPVSNSHDAGCVNASDQELARREFADGLQYGTCDTSIPICSFVAGCRLESEVNYTSFGTSSDLKIVVNSNAGNEVTVSLFVKDIRTQGEKGDLTFYEGNCESSSSIEISGEEITASLCNQANISKSKIFATTGDHLIQISSDYDFEYLAKIAIAF